MTSFLQALLLTSIKHSIATLLNFETFPLNFNYTEIMIIGLINLIKIFRVSSFMDDYYSLYNIFCIYHGTHPTVHIVSELTKVILVPIRNLFPIKKFV